MYMKVRFETKCFLFFFVFYFDYFLFPPYKSYLTQSRASISEITYHPIFKKEREREASKWIGFSNRLLWNGVGLEERK